MELLVNVSRKALYIGTDFPVTTQHRLMREFGRRLFAKSGVGYTTQGAYAAMAYAEIPVATAQHYSAFAIFW